MQSGGYARIVRRPKPLHMTLTLQKTPRKFRVIAGSADGNSNS